MDLKLNEFSSKELATIGLFLRNDLTFNPKDPEQRIDILRQILLELENRGEIDRLDAATAHKSLQTGQYRRILVFQPNFNDLSKKKINDFLQKNMKDFNLVKNWTKNYLRRSQKAKN